MRRFLLRSSAGVAVAALVTLLGIGTASAHVSIEPATAQRGSFTTLTFRVPNELSDSATTRLRVQLPPDHPMTSVLVRPVPGWTVTLEKQGPTAGQEGNQVETVSVITWEGGRIEPGYYENFEVTLGPLPDTGEVLYFPAIQYYDNGTEVPWIERPSADGTEPEAPAPELILVGTGAEGARDAHGQSTETASSNGATLDENASTSTEADSSSSTAIASISLGVAAVALLAAGAAWFVLIRRRTT
jgi:uncharacterized protein YcnI